jgi:methanogenic corrinoid protein MtbC1
MQKLVQAVRDLNDELALKLAKSYLAEGIEPLDIVEECRKGMMAVGDLYETGKYFLGDLVLSSEIFKDIMAELTPSLELANCPHHPKEKIVFGTVEGDIHDIGKDIAISLLRCYGFDVIDLGVDVPSEKFVASMQETGARILCLSILLNSCYSVLAQTISDVRQSPGGNNVNVLIGGLVNEKLCEYVKADAWVNDARKGVLFCQEWTTSK